jgi:hypothetical protein
MIRSNSHKGVFKLTPGQEEIAKLQDEGLDLIAICKKLKKSRASVYKAVVEIADKRQAVGNRK